MPLPWTPRYRTPCFLPFKLFKRPLHFPGGLTNSYGVLSFNKNITGNIFTDFHANFDKYSVFFDQSFARDFKSAIFAKSRKSPFLHYFSVKKKSAVIIVGKKVIWYKIVGRNFSHSPKITIENKGFENFGRK